MAEKSFHSKVAERVVERRKLHVKAILERHPIPPGFEKMRDLAEAQRRWREMPPELKRQMVDQVVAQNKLPELMDSGILGEGKNAS